MQRFRHIIITGGAGYIGARVSREALARGYEVTILSRSRSGLPRGARHHPWRLGQALPPECLTAHPPAAQAVIHLAHDWRNAPAPGADGNPAGEGGLNIAGTDALLQSCRALALGRFIFISSQSARADAANIYGRVKWRIEQRLDRAGETAARVGLVYGGPRQAMFGLLCRLTGLAPVLPMIDPWRQVQPIHVDEVADGVLRLMESQQAGWVGLAAAQGMPFGEFLRILARECHGKALPILPIPLRLALLGCEVTARLPLVPAIDRERVLGLAGTLPMACGAHLAALGLAPAPLAQGLRREPAARRAMLAEGRVLLRYVLGAAPRNLLLRRYARALQAAGLGALPLPAASRAMPALLRLAEPPRPHGALAQRLRLASTVVETSPQGQAALAGGRGGRAARLARLAAGLLIDAAAFPWRLLARG